MSFLSTLKEFGGKFTETKREKLDADEIKNISQIYVEERFSKEGDSFNVMVFLMKSGKQKSCYLSKMSDLEPGDKVRPKSVEFITLERGDEICTKADGEAL